MGLIILLVFILAFYLGILYLAYRGLRNLYSEIRTLINNRDKIKPTLKWALLHKKESLKNTCGWIKNNKAASFLLITLTSMAFYVYIFYCYSVPPLAGYVYDQDGKPIEDATVKIVVVKYLSENIIKVLSFPDRYSPPMEEKIYSPVKTDDKGYYQTKKLSFITDASVVMDLDIDKYEYNAITTKIINHCYLSINRSISNMDFERGGRFNIKSGLLYDRYKDKYGTYLQHSAKDNCYIARDWNISLSGHYDDKHPLLLPNFTLFNYDKLEKGINYEN